jgi:hypothetical protein
MRPVVGVELSSDGANQLQLDWARGVVWLITL